MARDTVGVAFQLKIDINELLKIVSLLTGIPQVAIFNDALDEFLKKYVKENHLEEEIELVQKARKKKKKKDQKEKK